MYQRGRPAATAIVRKIGNLNRVAAACPTRSFGKRDMLLPASTGFRGNIPARVDLCKTAVR